MAKNWGNRPWEIDFVPARKELPATLDFAIVGGGFSGLTAAVWLKTLAPDKSVALFEASVIGAGSSGHTGGMVLAESAAGDLPGLGDVLAGYQRILKRLKVDADLTLPGAFEIGRKRPTKNSPIRWQDSGELGVVAEVAGGSINPGKVVSGLARAAENAGVLLFENAAVEEMKFPDGLELQSAAGVMRATNVLFATNAYSHELNGLQGRVQSAFTIAVMTESLSDEALEQIGLSDHKPFYTVDLPYLWGRLFGNAIIFGSGLVFFDDWRGLNSLDIQKGDALQAFERLQGRIQRLHPALKDAKLTHRWGGPICISEEWKPLFERHRKRKNAIVLGAFSGHGVAQSVYLGAWAAEAMLGRRELPEWK
jgi:glycine/D-amino acid oxidase-like deaminating enzyme